MLRTLSGILACGVRLKGRLRNFFFAKAAIETVLPSGRSRSTSSCEPKDDARAIHVLAAGVAGVVAVAGAGAGAGAGCVCVDVEAGERARVGGP